MDTNEFKQINTKSIRAVEKSLENAGYYAFRSPEVRGSSDVQPIFPISMDQTREMDILLNATDGVLPAMTDKDARLSISDKYMALCTGINEVVAGVVAGVVNEGEIKDGTPDNTKEYPYALQFVDNIVRKLMKVRSYSTVEQYNACTREILDGLVFEALTPIQLMLDNDYSPLDKLLSEVFSNSNDLDSNAINAIYGLSQESVPGMSLLDAAIYYSTVRSLSKTDMPTFDSLNNPTENQGAFYSPDDGNLSIKKRLSFSSLWMKVIDAAGSPYLNGILLSSYLYYKAENDIGGALNFLTSLGLAVKMVGDGLIVYAKDKNRKALIAHEVGHACSWDVLPREEYQTRYDAGNYPYYNAKLGVAKLGMMYED